MAIKIGSWLEVVTPAGLRARKGPGLNAKVHTTVRPGYKFKVYKLTKKDGIVWATSKTYSYATTDESGKKMVKPTSPPASGGGGGSVRVKSPVPGKGVSTPYGKKPKDNTYWQTRGHHTGDDYAASEGANVVAVLDGEIRLADQKVLGKIILLYADNGDTYWYCHLSNRRVKSGQKVKAGQHIGDVGATGTGARGNHLHFEKRNGHTTSWGGKDLKPTW